jgi:hypothetical protein
MGSDLMITVLILFLCLAFFWTGFFLRNIFEEVKKEPKRIEKPAKEETEETPISKQWQNLRGYNGKRGTKD